jgi:hypothetical protein
MQMTKEQKALQIADDLDGQATQLNTFISDPQNPRTERQNAVARQLELRRQAAHIRVDLITDIVGSGVPALDEIVAAADRAKTAARKITKVKDALDLAAATITFFTALSSGQVAAIPGTWTAFAGAIKQIEATA